MSERRYQKNVTITPEQEAFAKANYGKMNNTQLAKMLGLNYGKTLNNLRVMGLYQPNPYNGILVEMKDYFDVDEFGKYYNF